MDLQALKSRRYDINKLVSAAQEAGGGEKGDRKENTDLWKEQAGKIFSRFPPFR